MRLSIAAYFGLGLLAFSGAANAADLPSRKAAPPVPAFVAYNWSGFYVGVNAGVNFANGGSITELPASGGATFYNVTGARSNLGDKTNFTGGATVGYNFQFNQFVVGVEGDFNYLGYRSSAVQRHPATGVPQYPPAGDTFGRKKADWLATIRARVGVAFDRLLVYATGGVAFSDLKYSMSDTCTAAPCGAGVLSGSSSPDYGWVLGGGVEYAIANNWTVKGEYLYNRFDSKKIRGNYIGGSGFPGFTNYGASKTEIHVVRLGLNYKF